MQRVSAMHNRLDAATSPKTRKRRLQKHVDFGSSLRKQRIKHLMKQGDVAALLSISLRRLKLIELGEEAPTDTIRHRVRKLFSTLNTPSTTTRVGHIPDDPEKEQKVKRTKNQENDAS